MRVMFAAPSGASLWHRMIASIRSRKMCNPLAPSLLAGLSLLLGGIIAPAGALALGFGPMLNEYSKLKVSTQAVANSKKVPKQLPPARTALRQ